MIKPEDIIASNISQTQKINSVMSHLDVVMLLIFNVYHSSFIGSLVISCWGWGKQPTKGPDLIGGLILDGFRICCHFQKVGCD